jgi:hypothetical protein
VSIEKPNVVDAVGIEKTTGSVMLTIADYLPWDRTSETQHLQMLHEKINAYLRFIESGELVQAYPAAEGKRPVISLVGRCDPSARALRFLSDARHTVEAAGIGFRFEKYVGEATTTG